MERELQLKMLLDMLKIRDFEETVRKMHREGRLFGAVHLYTGQEAVAVGACSALDKEDCITSTHRGHGHVIAKGGDVRYIMAELCGKKTGYNHGKGGSMHIARSPALGSWGPAASSGAVYQLRQAPHFLPSIRTTAVSASLASATEPLAKAFSMKRLVSPRL
jgi:TPP-dependent pyruvate/acetoin dehydrogenase alpha subunit